MLLTPFVVVVLIWSVLLLSGGALGVLVPIMLLANAMLASVSGKARARGDV